MDLRGRLLETKRFFEEQEKKYNGSDPLQIRCEFIRLLETYDKTMIEDIYCPFLEDTLMQFKDNPIYKQDLRFIELWLNYSQTQGNPVEIMERMHSRGLGTECAILYSSWAGLLAKQGLLTNADTVFKLGLSNDAKPKTELQQHYDEFLKDIGTQFLLGKLVCSNCRATYKITTNSKDAEEAKIWEWNPLKVGDVDDFQCPIAYFEDPDPTKKRMYPIDRVYPGRRDEFSLEEIMAEDYQCKYRELEAKQKAENEAKAREEEARQRALAEAKSKEEEARRAREQLNELRKKEAEKFNTINELNPGTLTQGVVQATIPVVTPQMLNLKDMDNSLANSTTFTVHTKEAMNVVQDMWSSPAPSDVHARKLFRSENAKKDFAPQLTAAKPLKFDIYTEDNAADQNSKQQPFQIFSENTDSRQTNQVPKHPFVIYDENAPPNQEVCMPAKQLSAFKSKTPFEIYNENQPLKTPSDILKDANVQKSNSQSLCKGKLFPDDDPATDLPTKLETQAKLQPFFNVQDRNDDFSDITCNTKAFEFVLPSSTPVALHKKPLLSAQKFEAPPAVQENTRLSVILESSKDKSSNSSTSSIASVATKTSRPGPLLLSVPDGFDPFSSTVLEELLNKIGFPKENHLNNYHTKLTSLPTGSKSMKLGDEVYSVLGEIGKGTYAKVIKANVKSKTVALKIEKPPCKWEYYIAKEIQYRVPPELAACFMDITGAYVYNNGSILETHYAKYGTLITNINLFKEKIGKSLDLGVVLHYCIELVDIVDYLHKSKIIHADLKPDNIVIRELPAHNEAEPCLQLIDFGRCIDLSLLPPGIEFTHVFKTEDNKCIEMKENKPWSYQIDLQGLASIFYCLLFSDYMKVIKKNDRWTLQKALSRNMKRELWSPIFDSLLNVNPLTDLPFNFDPMRQAFTDTFKASLNNYLQHISIYRNIISGK